MSMSRENSVAGIGNMIINTVMSETNEVISSTKKVGFMGGNPVLVRTFIAKVLVAENVEHDWVAKRKASSSSGVATGDAKNMKAALTVFAISIKKTLPEGQGTGPAIAAVIDDKMAKYVVESTTEVTESLSLDGNDDTLDLGGLEVDTAEVTEEGNYLLDDKKDWAGKVMTADVGKAYRTMLTPDNNGMVHGTFGGCSNKFKEAAAWIKYVEEGVKGDKHQFVLAGVGLEALQIAPRRKTVSSDMLNVLVAFKDRKLFASVVTRIGAFLINNLGIHDKRFAGHVSPKFRELVLKSVGIDEDELSLPSNLQSKAGWTWTHEVYNRASYTTVVTDEELNDLMMNI